MHINYNRPYRNCQLGHWSGIELSNVQENINIVKLLDNFGNYDRNRKCQFKNEIQKQFITSVTFPISHKTKFHKYLSP